MKQPNYSKILLEGEIKHFTDLGIQKFIEACIEEFPDYFWKVPASGSGKFHPEDENTPGGLVTHTRRVIRMIEHLGNLYGLSFWETDVLRAAAILHDSFCKGLNGQSRNTNTDVFHPLYVRHNFPWVGFGDRYTDEKTYDEIMYCVESHSARWSVSKVLNVDKKLPNIFKVADYIASRKEIKVKVERGS
jgi:hypothetical protein